MFLQIFGNNYSLPVKVVAFGVVTYGFPKTWIEQTI
jgi:hypothetical protein